MRDFSERLMSSRSFCPGTLKVAATDKYRYLDYFYTDYTVSNREYISSLCPMQFKFNSMAYQIDIKDFMQTIGN